jgi:hypothetical protein
MGKVDAWLGITADESTAETDNKIPMWNGAGKTAKYTWVSVWVAIAISAFLLANARMPNADGFGGFIPLYLAVFIFVAGIAVTERSVVRFQNNMGDRNGKDTAY